MSRSEGARIKLFGGDSGRYKQEVFLDSVALPRHEARSLRIVAPPRRVRRQSDRRSVEDGAHRGQRG